jgi:hypothetical protein
VRLLRLCAIAMMLVIVLQTMQSPTPGRRDGLHRAAPLLSIPLLLSSLLIGHFLATCCWRTCGPTSFPPAAGGAQMVALIIFGMFIMLTIGVR